MPGKRSSRKKTEQFFCPYCEKRLWRLGGSKHHLLLASSSIDKQNLQLSSKSFKEASEKSACLDPDQWIEEFFCSEHSNLWMLVYRTIHNRLTSVVASKADWQCSTGNPPIDLISSSVSEFSVRMSRRADMRLRHRRK